MKEIEKGKYIWHKAIVRVKSFKNKGVVIMKSKVPQTCTMVNWDVLDGLYTLSYMKPPHGYTVFTRDVYNAVAELSRYGNKFLLNQLVMAVYKTDSINEDMAKAVESELDSLNATQLKYTIDDVIDAYNNGTINKIALKGIQDEFGKEIVSVDGSVLSYEMMVISNISGGSNSNSIITILSRILPIRFVEYCFVKYGYHMVGE